MSIELQGLTKIYSHQRAIDNISFNIGKGEVVGFLGPNGAGKSTTMKILSGYIPQSSGKAYVMGMDIAKEPLKIKQKIGYLPELNPLYGDMYITEYLQFNADIYGIKNPKSAIERVIESTGLGLERKKKIGQLSKGYKQRVGLAQALINDPDVLILDEPTSGLDPNQMSEIRKLILRLGEDKTILLSTHIMQEVEAMCSRAIIINLGKIVADDNVAGMKNRLTSKTKRNKIKFRNPIDVNALMSEKGIVEVETLGDNRYVVRSEATLELAEVLFNFAIASNTIILEQMEESESLESVFQQLTRNV
jgi:ABC-2 type transport system ATP-binding protein